MNSLVRQPLHLQVSEMLVREIRSGLLPVGDRLPPERDMAEKLNISVGTLRKALADLESKSMLQRVQGSGNYVRDNPDVGNVYALFRLELIKGGGLPTAETIDVKRLKKPLKVPDFGPSTMAIRIRRIRFLSDTPVSLEEIWLDGSFAGKIAKSDLSDSMYEYYREKLGFWISRAEDRVSVASFPDWSPADVFPKRKAWGYIERVSRDQNGNPAEFSRTWFDPVTTQFVSR